MGKQGKYRIFLLCSLIILIFASCTKKEYVNNYDKQKTSLRSYMETLSSGYVIVDGDVYVSLVSDQSEDNAEPVENGDTISIYYAEYILQGSSLGTMIWSNNEAWINTDNWLPDDEMDFNPLEFAYGNGAVVKGLTAGLRGCKKGQELIIAMPFTKAYGDKWMSTVPPYSAIVFRVFVQDITKKQ